MVRCWFDDSRELNTTIHIIITHAELKNESVYASRSIRVYTGIYIGDSVC